MSKIKNELRKSFSQKRNNYVLDDNKYYCANTFIKSDLYKLSDVLLVYYPIKSEPDTLIVIQKAFEDNKQVFLPKVDGDMMTFLKIKSLDTLKKGAFNIPEPESNISYDNQNAVCIVPGLAFDKNGNRLGYGKGYYDRFLCGKDNIVTVAFCPKCNFTDNLPTDKTDILMKYLIVDDEIYKI